MDALTSAERLAARSRSITLVALALLTLLAWAWLFGGAGMKSMAMPMEGMSPMAWGANQWLLVISMWWVMMIAMMLPSAAPAILLYGRVNRHGGQAPSTTAFLAGYLACWLGFSLVAAWLQIAATSPMSMALDNREASATLLIAAGLYQLSPFKNACLNRCRSPAQFLTRHYRPGTAGAARLGLLHGAYCVGCCWLLMALLFVVGVMNLAWVAVLTLLVAAEKLLAGGKWIARVSGVGLVGWGVLLLVN